MLYHQGGVEIIPGNCGKDCPQGSKAYTNEKGERISFCLTCNYLKCCLNLFDMRLCRVCRETRCPRQTKKLL